MTALTLVDFVDALNAELETAGLTVVAAFDSNLLASARSNSNYISVNAPAPDTSATYSPRTGSLWKVNAQLVVMDLSKRTAAEVMSIAKTTLDSWQISEHAMLRKCKTFFVRASQLTGYSECISTWTFEFYEDY